MTGARPPVLELLAPPLRQRLEGLDALWGQDRASVPRRASRTEADRRPALTANAPSGACQFDVALVGGGLSLLLAPLLARRGLSVVVLERAVEAAPHREWNASFEELRALVHAGLVTNAELNGIIVARYGRGICRWHGGDTQEVLGVLDCAVDAHGLWHLARARAREAQVPVYTGVAVMAEQADDLGVELQLQILAPQPNPLPDRLRVRVMVDARGASSPYAQSDLVCPTVGGVLRGLMTGDGPTLIDPTVGEILVTTEGVEDGRQHLWEAFPGRDGEVAVYLFYYAEPHTLPSRPLARLYERFAAKLASYKRGDWQLVRPTFGMIPGHSRLRPAPQSPHQRIVLVGDAAARQSPLTFCGFGAMLRSLSSACEGIAQAARGEAAGRPVVDDAPVHEVTGALALMLARAHRNGPHKTNALLNAAFSALASQGAAGMNALLQDSMSQDEAVRFLWKVGQRYPAVWPAVLRQLGATNALSWAWRLRRPLANLMTAPA